ncbi:MAG: LPS export ABC transporter ATP-binding protein [Planctomycetota bacterium]
MPRTRGRPPSFMAGTLEVRQLVKTYAGRTVVDRVSFRLRSGEVIGLLGRNGAGKTTSFRMAIGMIRPRSGIVILNGEDVTEQPMYRRAQRGLGYLAQEPAVFRRLSVEQNIAAILELRGWKRKDIKKRVDELLAEFGLQMVRNNKAGSLSGGERRRLEIARALSTNPQIMLLDEPLYGVDPIAVSEIIKLIHSLRRRDIGILITEHNVEKVLPILDRAYIIHEGRVIFSGSPDEVVANEAVREFYLGRDFRLPDASASSSGD